MQDHSGAHECMQDWTRWHCSTKRLSVSYLKLFKAGAKHELLVNDQPQRCDSMANLVRRKGNGCTVLFYECHLCALEGLTASILNSMGQY